MEIINKGKDAVERSISVLQNGGLVIFPCETVYGIAVDSQNPEAVKRLNDFKQRPLGKPYAIMCSSQEMVEKYVDLNDSAKNLYKTFLPGPVTVISKSKGNLAKGIESEFGTAGVRIPDYKFMLDLIEKFGQPIVATSANASYQKRPYKISDVLDNISKKQKSLIDLIIDAGELPHNEPSTVIDTTLDTPTVLRQGNIKLKDKNEVLSRSEENTQNIGKELWQKYEQYLGKRAIIFALEGEMGTGKTQFTKGLARAMGIKDVITSPTFNLVNSYGVLNHFDVWRLTDSKELEALGFLKMIEDKNMVISIEWAEKVADLIKKYRDQVVVVWVRIKYLPLEASAKWGGNIDNMRLISWGVL